MKSFDKKINLSYVKRIVLLNSCIANIFQMKRSRQRANYCL